MKYQVIKQQQTKYLNLAKLFPVMNIETTKFHIEITNGLIYFKIQNVVLIVFINIVNIPQENIYI